MNNTDVDVEKDSNTNNNAVTSKLNNDSTSSNNNKPTKQPNSNSTKTSNHDSTKTPKNNPPKDNQTSSNASNISLSTGRELKFRARLPKEEKMQVLKAFIGRVTDRELAVRLQCSTRTISTYKSEFFDSPEYWLSVDEELYSLLHDSDISKTERLRIYAQLKKQHMMTASISSTVNDCKIVLNWSKSVDIKDLDELKKGNNEE